MKPLSHPLEFFACRTLSSTIFSGQGSSRSAVLSPITATSPTPSDPKCGRRSARIVSRLGESAFDFDFVSCTNSVVAAKVSPVWAAFFALADTCRVTLLLCLDADWNEIKGPVGGKAVVNKALGGRLVKLERNLYP